MMLLMPPTCGSRHSMLHPPFAAYLRASHSFRKHDIRSAFPTGAALCPDAHLE